MAHRVGSLRRTDSVAIEGIADINEALLAVGATRMTRFGHRLEGGRIGLGLSSSRRIGGASSTSFSERFRFAPKDPAPPFAVSWHAATDCEGEAGHETARVRQPARRSGGSHRKPSGPNWKNIPTKVTKVFQKPSDLWKEWRRVTGTGLVCAPVSPPRCLRSDDKHLILRLEVELKALVENVNRCHRYVVLSQINKCLVDIDAFGQVEVVAKDKVNYII